MKDANGSLRPAAGAVARPPSCYGAAEPSRRAKWRRVPPIGHFPPPPPKRICDPEGDARSVHLRFHALTRAIRCNGVCPTAGRGEESSPTRQP